QGQGKGALPTRAEDVGCPDIAAAQLAEVLVAIDLHHQPARGNGAEEVAEGQQGEHFQHGGVLKDASTIDRGLWRCHPCRLSRFGSDLGSSSVNSLPTPGRLSTSTRPPCARATSCTR